MAGSARQSVPARPDWQGAPFRAVFHRSSTAMLIADDTRRYIDANRAASRLLLAPRSDLLERCIDDLTVPEVKPHLDGIWSSFLELGAQEGQAELMLLGGERLTVNFSATANIVPGRHLCVLLPEPAAEQLLETAEFSALRESLAPSRLVPRLDHAISAREREVVALLALGARDKEIAEILGIAEKTVGGHVRNAMAKLGAKTRPHAVALALSARLVSFSAPATAIP